MRAVTGWWIIRWSHGSAADDGSYARARFTAAILPPSVPTVLPPSISCRSALLASSCRQVSVIRVAVEKKFTEGVPTCPRNFLSPRWRPDTGKKGLNDGGPGGPGPSDEIEGALAARRSSPWLCAGATTVTATPGPPPCCTCSHRASWHLVARTLSALRRTKVTAWPIACRRRLPRYAPIFVSRSRTRIYRAYTYARRSATADRSALKRGILRWSVSWR